MQSVHSYDETPARRPERHSNFVLPGLCGCQSAAMTYAFAIKCKTQCMHQKPNGRCNKYQYRGRLAACHKHQTRMKETPARGPERHYEGVGGTQRFATSVKRDETVVHLILDVLDFLGSFKKNRNTVRYSQAAHSGT